MCGEMYCRYKERDQEKLYLMHAEGGCSSSKGNRGDS